MLGEEASVLNSTLFGGKGGGGEAFHNKIGLYAATATKVAKDFDHILA